MPCHYNWSSLILIWRHARHSYISVYSWHGAFQRPAEEQIASLIMESCQASRYIRLVAPFALPSGAWRLLALAKTVHYLLWVGWRGRERSFIASLK